MAGTIGIKIANGEFYPILDENSAAKKRLVLTTAHDNQSSARVDMFRSISKSMLDAQYIGSLVVEGLGAGFKKEVSIEMIISSDEGGNITAEAYDLESGSEGDRNVLNVSLRTMDAFAKPDDFPDFDADDGQRLDLGTSRPQRAARERKFPWLIMIAATLLVIMGILALWFFMLGGREFLPPAAGGPVPEHPPAAEQPPVFPELASPEQPPEVGPQAAAEFILAPTAPPPMPEIRSERPSAPPMPLRVPTSMPPEGVSHMARMGDTLWDISAAFYRDPSLYPRIAQINDIEDPNDIAAGFNVAVPPLD